MAKKERSPIKDRPLNVPGQSGDSALSDFVDNHFVAPLLCVGALCVIGLWEAVAAAKHLPRQPGVILFIAFGAALVTSAYWRYRWKRAMAMKLGRDGERVVGQFLDFHVPDDATVFHDVPGTRGNIDHVVICSRGIYSIETKTRTKPAKGPAVVLVEEERLTVNGHIPDRDPVMQAMACADELRQILKDSTGKRFDVKPVVVFPGWFIEDKRKTRFPWILEPKALPAWIGRENVTISSSDVQMATYHLSRYVRANPK